MSRYCFIVHVSLKMTGALLYREIKIAAKSNKKRGTIQSTKKNAIILDPDILGFF